MAFCLFFKGLLKDESAAVSKTLAEFIAGIIRCLLRSQLYFETKAERIVEKKVSLAAYPHP